MLRVEKLCHSFKLGLRPFYEHVSGHPRADIGGLYLQLSRVTLTWVALVRALASHNSDELPASLQQHPSMVCMTLCHCCSCSSC